jgi:hypothetical protein
MGIVGDCRVGGCVVVAAAPERGESGSDAFREARGSDFPQYTRAERHLTDAHVAREARTLRVREASLTARPTDVRYPHLRPLPRITLCVHG